jgi:hypothetical protein
MNSHSLHLPYLFFGLKGERSSLPSGNEDEICIANIGPREQQRRFRFGAVMFVISLASAALLIFMGVDRGWRLGLFVPFYLATIGFFQAHEKT